MKYLNADERRIPILPVRLLGSLDIRRQYQKPRERERERGREREGEREERERERVNGERNDGQNKVPPLMVVPPFLRVHRLPLNRVGDHLYVLHWGYFAWCLRSLNDTRIEGDESDISQGKDGVQYVS